MSSQSAQRVQLLSLNFFVLGFLSTLVGVIIPDLKAEFGVTNEQAGVSFVCWSSGSFVGAYLGGWLFTPRRMRGLFVGCSAAALLMLLALALVPSMLGFNVCVFALSLIGSILFTTGHTSAADGARHGKAATLSLMDFFVSLGNFATPFLAGGLSWLAGTGTVWRWLLLAAAVPFVGIAALASAQPRERTPLADVHCAQPSALARYGQLLQQPIFLTFFAVSVLLHAAEWAHSVWFVSYASEAVGLTVPEAQGVLGFFLAGMAVSRLVCSALLRRFEARALVSVFVVGAAVAASLIPLQHAAAPLAALNFALGFCFGVCFPILLGLTMELTPGHSSLLSGLGLMGGTLGAQGLSYAIGVVADRASLGAAYRFVPFAMLAFAASVLAFAQAYPRARRRRFADALAR